MFLVDLDFIKPGLDQPHVKAYKRLRKGIRDWDRNTRNRVKQLPPPRGGDRLIELMAEAEGQEEAEDQVSEDEIEEEENEFGDRDDSKDGGDDGIVIDPEGLL